jgi:thiamine-phosphate pyrophosphorylase
MVVSLHIPDLMNKCILITYPERLNGELEIIEHLFHSGLEYLHLRKPHWSKDLVEELICGISPSFYSRIVLHQHYELVKKYRLRGIHITEKYKNQGLENEFENYHVSISSHSFEELKNLDFSYDYAFLSPVFDSLSKKQYSGRFKPDQLKAFLSASQTEVPVIALGGIDLDNLHIVKEVGFEGFAILGSIWEELLISSSPDFDKTITKFLKIQEFVNQTKTA